MKLVHRDVKTVLKIISIHNKDYQFNDNGFNQAFSRRTELNKYSFILKRVFSTNI